MIALAYGALALLAILLLIALVTDLKRRLIYNWCTVAVALLAPVYWLAHGEGLWPDAAIHLLVAIITFILFAIAFRIGMMGGGDVKLFAALALWFEWPIVVQLVFVASVLGGVVTVAAALHHRWAKREGGVEVPYGVAIALAGLIFVTQRYLNHFA